MTSKRMHETHDGSGARKRSRSRNESPDSASAASGIDNVEEQQVVEASQESDEIEDTGRETDDNDFDNVSEPFNDDANEDMFDFFSGKFGRVNTADVIAGSVVVPAELGDSDRPREWQRVSLPGPSDIRIFSIEPTKLDSERLHCTFRGTSLSEPEEYFAFSYAWGTSHADGSHLTDTIYCDDCPVKITSTLYQALKRMREMQHAGLEIPALWIDAICIDQNNVIERGRQVMLMGKIYDKAHALLVWLGEPDEGKSSSSGIDRIRNLDENDVYPLIYHDGNDDIPPTISKALQTRPFFKRRWVIQEAFLSPTPHWILVGSHRLLTPNLPDCLRDPSQTLELYDPTRNAEKNASKTTAKSDIQRECLMQHLIDFHEFKCSDDRDQVYALRDISCDGQKLTIDYRLTTAELYTALAIHWIRSGHLVPVLLCSVQRQRSLDWYPSSSDTSLPFWVPDWRIPPIPRDTRSTQWPRNHVVKSATYDEATGQTTTVSVPKVAGEVPVIDVSETHHCSSAMLESSDALNSFRGAQVTHPLLTWHVLCVAVQGIIFRRCNLHHGFRETQASGGTSSCPWCFFSTHAPLNLVSEPEMQFVFGECHTVNESFCVLENTWILGLQPSPYQDPELGREVYRVTKMYETQHLRFENDMWIGVHNEEHASDSFGFQEFLIC